MHTLIIHIIIKSYSLMTYRLSEGFLPSELLQQFLKRASSRTLAAASPFCLLPLFPPLQTDTSPCKQCNIHLYNLQKMSCMLVLQMSISSFSIIVCSVNSFPYKQSLSSQCTVTYKVEEISKSNLLLKPSPGFLQGFRFLEFFHIFSKFLQALLHLLIS